MAEAEQQQDSSKTLVSFVVGLLIGGMLVWAFSGPSSETAQPPVADETAQETEDTNETQEGEDTNDQEQDISEETSETATLELGEGSVTVEDQAAGMSVALEQATYPIEEGWIGVRDYNNGQLSFIKGVVRFSAAAGLVPQDIVLQVPTQPGQEYAVVMFSDDGDNTFNAAGDVQIDQIFATFTAQ